MGQQASAEASRQAVPAPAGQEPAAGAPLVWAVRITGNDNIRQSKLLGLLKTQAGKPFDAALFERDIRAVEEYYHKAGYPLAHVTTGFGMDSQGVVCLPIDEGRIEKIVVKGAKKTRAYVIQRELESQAGRAYRGGTVKGDRQRLYNLGFFESVSIAPSAGSEPGKAVLTVDVKERETGSIMAAMGFSSAAGLIGFAEWSDANFMGTGQTLALNWQRGAYTSLLSLGNDGNYEAKVRTGLDIAYFTPWLFHQRLSAGLRLYDTATQQAFYFSQDTDPANIKNYEWRRGLLFTAAREIGRGTTLGILGRADKVDYSVAPTGAEWPAGESVSPTKITSVRFSAARGPMNPFSEMNGVPRTGAFLEIGRGSSQGSTAGFQKFGLTSTHYLQVTPKNTLAARAQVGWSAGQVPFSELYAVGGAQSVRSYAYSRFLGTRMFVVNTELRHELRKGMAGVAFVDLGYAWPRATGFSFTSLRPALGLGMRVATPFGPIRLDYAFGGGGGRFHLTTGDSF